MKAKVIEAAKWFVFRYRPYFEWGMDYPAPYIWAGWWLITFNPTEIHFMPD